MTVYLVTRRRLSPGRAGHYLHAVDEAYRRWKRIPGLVSSCQFATAPDDPDTVLTVVGSENRDNFRHSAFHDRQHFRVIEHLVVGPPYERGYFEMIRQQEYDLPKPDLLLVSRISVPEGDTARFLKVALGMGDSIIRMRGVSHGRLLRGIDQPTEFLSLIAFTQSADVAAMARAIGTFQRTHPTWRVARFIGDLHDVGRSIAA